LALRATFDGVSALSSGNLVLPSNTSAFSWSSALDPADYIFVTYRVTSPCSGEEAALGMAMEQSASTLYIKGYASPQMLEDWTIRVCRVHALAAQCSEPVVPAYFLNTEVYARQAAGQGNYEVELAVPTRLLKNKPAQLLNVLIGELPRLGFLTSFRLTEVRLPAQFGPGPSFGKDGILQLLDKQRGPLLCRAMRPGVGLDTAVMAALNRDVLVGGFHLVKDDELLCHEDTEAYRYHLESMITARDEAMQLTGERKLYLANLFCEPDELIPRWELACELGVDGVLVAPFIQGLGVLPLLARQRQLPLLAHNSAIDMLTRHAAWGIDDAVICHWLRHLGADWFVTPGTFATPAMPPQESRRLMEAAYGEFGSLLPMMPNLQGGKFPGDLPRYREAVGSENFMLIVAHWVDSHSDGLERAARLFREAVDAV
jgi:ribulose 1,5-bisphosphate carboxylase large subunit-like protein